MLLVGDRSRRPEDCQPQASGLRFFEFRLLRVLMFSNCVLSLPASVPVCVCLCVCVSECITLSWGCGNTYTNATARRHPLLLLRHPTSDSESDACSSSGRTCSACCGRCLPASSLLVLLKLRARTVEKPVPPARAPSPPLASSRVESSLFVRSLLGRLQTRAPGAPSLERFFV